MSDDTFSVLLNYVEATGEKLNQEHAATACGFSKSTLSRRLNAAKSALTASGGKIADGGASADFKVILKYVELTGSKLKTKEAAKACNTSVSTIGRRVAAAKKEMEDAEGATSAGAEVTGEAEGEAGGVKNAGEEEGTVNDEEAGIAGDEIWSQNLTAGVAYGTDLDQPGTDAEPATEEAEGGMKRKIDEVEDTPASGEGEAVKKLKQGDEKEELQTTHTAEEDKEGIAEVKQDGEVGAEMEGEMEKKEDALETGVVAGEELIKHV